MLVVAMALEIILPVGAARIARADTDCGSRPSPAVPPRRGSGCRCGPPRAAAFRRRRLACEARTSRTRPGRRRPEIVRLGQITPDERNRTFTAWLAATLSRRCSRMNGHGRRSSRPSIPVPALLRRATVTHRPGDAVEWDLYLNSQDSVPIYGSYCCTLGVLWDTGKSFSGFTPPNNALGIGDDGRLALDRLLMPLGKESPRSTPFTTRRGSSRAMRVRPPVRWPAWVHGGRLRGGLLDTGSVAHRDGHRRVRGRERNRRTAHRLRSSGPSNRFDKRDGGGELRDRSDRRRRADSDRRRMKIADVAQRNIFDEKIRYAASHPNFCRTSSDRRLKTEQQAGALVPALPSRLRGSRVHLLRHACPTDFHVSALNCTRDATSFIRQTYTREARELELPTFTCPVGFPVFQTDGLLLPDPKPGYTCTQRDLHPELPDRLRHAPHDLLRGAATQPRASYGRGAGSATAPSSQFVEGDQANDPVDPPEMARRGSGGLRTLWCPTLHPGHPAERSGAERRSDHPVGDAHTTSTQPGGTIYEGTFFSIDYVVYDPNVGDTQTIYAAWSDGASDSLSRIERLVPRAEPRPRLRPARQQGGGADGRGCGRPEQLADRSYRGQQRGADRHGERGGGLTRIRCDHRVGVERDLVLRHVRRLHVLRRSTGATATGRSRYRSPPSRPCPTTTQRVASSTPR